MLPLSSRLKLPIMDAVCTYIHKSEHTYFYYLCVYRGYELLLLYSVIASGEQEFCPNVNEFNSTNNTSNEDDGDDVEKFTNIAKYITFYSVCFEFSVGYLTLLCFLIKFSFCTKDYSCSFACGGFARNRLGLCCFHSEAYIEEFSKAIPPFLMIDAILFLTIAPISNVHPFIVTCVAGYILTGFRIASYVLTFILLFGFRYYKFNEFKITGVLPLSLDFFGLFLNLLTVSSSLATLVELGIPEMKSIQISYAIATFISVIITYIKYYTAIDNIRVSTANDKTEDKKICYEVMCHVTFWIKLLFADIVLIVLNFFIWTQHFKEDFRYAGLSLILTVVSTLFGTAIYVCASQFCQHDPLYKYLYKCCKCDSKLKSIKKICG